MVQDRVLIMRRGLLKSLLRAALGALGALPALQSRPYQQLICDGMCTSDTAEFYRDFDLIFISFRSATGYLPRCHLVLLKAEFSSGQWFFSSCPYRIFFIPALVAQGSKPSFTISLQPICVCDDPPFNVQRPSTEITMRASNVVLLVLTVYAATPALAVPLSASDSVDIHVPSDIESRNPQIDSLVTARAGDGDAALSEIFARNIPVLKSKREKTGPLPQSLSSRELGPHQRLNARFKYYSLSSIIKGLTVYYRFAKDAGVFRGVRARDDVADDFITSLLQSRDPEITPENIFALASRVFDDLD